MSYEHYERQRKLGQGSFGSVFLVKDNRDGRSYVMKEVDLTTMGPQGRREALKEVQFLSKQSHPAIIGYREWFERTVHSKKILYIVMEFADGGDLSGLIKNRRGRNQPEEQIIYYMVQILLALLHMHSNHIMHRDIKAENVFLTRDNYVKLGDFGISRSLDNTAAQARTRIGTPYYLSPEICLDRPYGTGNDMWALGVVLYQLCALKHPFDASSMESQLHAIVHTKHRPLSNLYSKPLRDLIDALLSKKAVHRPSVVKVLALPWIKDKVNAYLQVEKHSPEYVSCIRKAWDEARPHHGGQHLDYAGVNDDAEVDSQGVGVGDIAQGVVQSKQDPDYHQNNKQSGGVVVSVHGQQEHFGSYQHMKGREEPGSSSNNGNRFRPSNNQQAQQPQQPAQFYQQQAYQHQPPQQQQQQQPRYNAPSMPGMQTPVPARAPVSSSRYEQNVTPRQARLQHRDNNRSGSAMAAVMGGYEGGNLQNTPNRQQQYDHNPSSPSFLPPIHRKQTPNDQSPVKPKVPPRPQPINIQRASRLRAWK